MDRIVIPAIPLRGRVGVTEAERRDDQDLSVAVTLHVDLRRAGESDRLADTVDYEAVCAEVGRVVGSRAFHLIEAVAEAIARAVLAGFACHEVEVRVEKPGALAERGVPFAAVEIRRRRDA